MLYAAYSIYMLRAYSLTLYAAGIHPYDTGSIFPTFFVGMGLSLIMSDK